MASFRTAITAATAATTYDFQVTSNNPVTIVGYGYNAGADVVDLQVSYDGGTSFVNCYKDGTQVQLTNTNNPLTVYGPGWFRLNKGITAEAVGAVVIHEP